MPKNSLLGPVARLRRQFTLDPETVQILERYAEDYHNGNVSKAADELLKKGRQLERIELAKSLAYAGLGTAALLILGLV